MNSRSATSAASSSARLPAEKLRVRVSSYAGTTCHRGACLGRNPPDHPARLLDRASWEKGYFWTGQIYPKPWRVRIDLVADSGAMLTYRVQLFSRTDPPQDDVDLPVTINKLTKKVDYGTAPASWALVQAVTKISHPQYYGGPLLPTITLEI